MNPTMQNIQSLGISTDSYLVCAREVNNMYSESPMSKSVSESLMRDTFGVVVETDHDKAANVALRYMISEYVRNTEKGVVLSGTDLVRIATQKTKSFFLNQPWMVPGAHSSIQDIPGAVEVVDVPVEDIQIGRVVVGTKTIKPKKGLKQEAAKRIYEANRGKPNKDIIALFMSQLDMSKPGATTYLHNMKKALGDVTEGAKRGRKSTKGVA